ncbi:unnamed protein product, partial [Allacma fusca]
YIPPGSNSHGPGARVMTSERHFSISFQLRSGVSTRAKNPEEILRHAWYMACDAEVPDQDEVIHGNQMSAIILRGYAKDLHIIYAQQLMEI